MVEGGVQAQHGGTVGALENAYYIEAMRELRLAKMRRGK